MSEKNGFQKTSLYLPVPLPPDSHYSVARDRTEPGPQFLKQLSNYTVRSVLLVLVVFLIGVVAVVV